MPVFKVLAEVAEELDIPLIFNAIGIEGNHNSNDKQYKKLKKILNKKCVKMCSTRDRIDVLKEYIDSSDVTCRKVCDTGVWTSEALGIKKDEDSNLIGLNVIIPERFKDYGKNISENDLLEFWKNLSSELLKKGYKIKFFTNGMIADYQFAKKIVDYCHYNQEVLIDIPKDEVEMVKNISKFKAIIANRLHSCIAAYSLDIPAIGLAWNDKLLFWGNEINKNECFFDYNELNYIEIIKQMEYEIKNGYNQEYKKDFKKSVYDFLDQTLDYI